MAPFVVAAVVAASLFGTGTVVKPVDPVAGTVLQAAGVGTLVGGALGTIGGTAAALGSTAATGVAVGATVGGVVGGVGGV